MNGYSVNETRVAFNHVDKLKKKYSALCINKLTWPIKCSARTYGLLFKQGSSHNKRSKLNQHVNFVQLDLKVEVEIWCLQPTPRNKALQGMPGKCMQYRQAYLVLDDIVGTCGYIQVHRTRFCVVTNNKIIKVRRTNLHTQNDYLKIRRIGWSCAINKYEYIWI